ncbi:uncharacterized protein LOC112127029 [Cimex lectularius]|uniref:Salivary secreted protein n=1 Tax=Cimex lectularius TaxID=79782 RepID=A0A8I6SIE0_CIMLE|nr:uncharacterized protein LOC112127029 [Cimex lectularius]
MFKFGFVLCAVLCAVLTLSQGLYLAEKKVPEKNVDGMVNKLIQETTRGLQPKISLPKMNEDFKLRVMIINFRGTLEAEGGWLKNMTTLTRTGPVELKKDKETVSVSFPVRLNELKFGFDEIKISVLSTGASCSIDVSVGENSFNVRFTVKKDKSGCTTTLDKTDVTSFKNFKTKATVRGRKVTPYVYNVGVNLMENQFYGKIGKSLSDYLKHHFDEVLKKNVMCQLLNM